MPLISIIIPAYNTEKYLPQAIGSVLSQSYKDTEIIIVNDGSKDRTPIIADSYKKKDVRVKLFNQNNKGLSAARNTGIQNASGEIIAFLDSDDWWHSTYLEIMASRLISQSSLGISFARIQYADENGNLIPMFTRGHVEKIKKEDFFYMNPLSCGSNLVMKRKHLESTGLFDESLKKVEDLDFLYRAASNEKYRISGIKDYLVYYRLREGLSHDTDGMATSWNQFMQKVKQHNKHDYDKHYLPALLSQKIFFARRAQQAGAPPKISLNYLGYCLKNPLAFFRLALRYPVLAFYSFPMALARSLLRWN